MILICLNDQDQPIYNPFNKLKVKLEENKVDWNIIWMIVIVKLLKIKWIKILKIKPKRRKYM